MLFIYPQVLLSFHVRNLEYRCYLYTRKYYSHVIGLRAHPKLKTASFPNLVEVRSQTYSFRTKVSQLYQNTIHK